MDVKQNVIDKILMSLSGYEIDLQAFEFKLAEIFHGYQVTEEAKSLVPYSEGKNVIFIKRWILSKAIAGCSERTLQEYQNEVSKALSSIGKDADEVQANDIKNFFAIKLMNGCSKSYVDTIRRYLSSFFAFLTKEELIMRNPMNRVDKIKYHKEKKKAFMLKDKIRDPEIKNAVAAVEEKLAGEGRVLVRVSGTEPLVRVTIEGKDLDAIKEMAEDLAALISRKYS